MVGFSAAGWPHGARRTTQSSRPSSRPRATASTRFAAPSLPGDRVEVGLDRAHRHEELGRDLGVGPPEGDQAQDLELACGQRFDGAVDDPLAGVGGSRQRRPRRSGPMRSKRRLRGPRARRIAGTGRELEGATRGGIGELGADRARPAPEPWRPTRRRSSRPWTPPTRARARPRRGAARARDRRVRWRCAARSAIVRPAASVLPAARRSGSASSYAAAAASRSPARTSARPSSAAAVPRSVASASAGSRGRDEVAREARLRDRRGTVPFEPGQLRAEERELGRDRRPHHRTAVAPVAERPLGVGEPLGDSLGLADEEEAPGVRRAELGVAADDVRRQGVEPPPHRAQLARVDVSARGDGDDPARALEIARPEGMADRLVVIPPLLVPGRRPRVQLGDLIGMERRATERGGSRRRARGSGTSAVRRRAG